MRTVIQRVSKASITIKGTITSKISTGLVVFLGVEYNDDLKDALWLANKILALRIFPDVNGVMNQSIVDVKGEILVVSQFTLHARVKKGNRPSFINAAAPEIAIPLYNLFIDKLQNLSGTVVEKGKFGADMKVELINDGPVTIIMDNKK